MINKNNRKNIIYVCGNFDIYKFNNVKEQANLLKDFAKNKKILVSTILIDEEDNMDFEFRVKIHKLINMILNDKVDKLILYKKSNICFFKTTVELFEKICKKHKCEIIEYKED